MMMRKKIACLHAHNSNISYIETALSPYDIELVHFVDPGLMNRVMTDKSFTLGDGEKKVKDQVEWIAQSAVDAILITCTNYIALLKEEELTINVPIIKIDEPFFRGICQMEQQQTILFTNPDTVPGTMKRLHQYAQLHHKRLDIEVKVIENTFELIMSGKNEEYNTAVRDYIKQLDRTQNLAVAQLSMVAAAQEVEDEIPITILNPLNTLVSTMVAQLNLKKAEQR
jgi:aspartate/glutamate racemase